MEYEYSATNYGTLDMRGREPGTGPSANAKGRKTEEFPPTNRHDRVAPDAPQTQPSGSLMGVQTTRCSVWRTLMHAETRKSLISLKSLIPVITITGNSKCK